MRDDDYDDDVTSYAEHLQDEHGVEEEEAYREAWLAFNYDDDFGFEDWDDS